MLSMLPGGDTGDGYVALQQLSLWKICTVLDYKRRELLHPFPCFFFSLFWSRENLKLAADLTNSPDFSVPKYWSLQTQLLCVGVLSDNLASFCFSESLSLHPTIFQMVLFFPYLRFCPSALNCCCGLQDLNA